MSRRDGSEVPTSGLEIRAGHKIGERDHPATGRHKIYVAARPVRGMRIAVGDEAKLAEVRRASLAEVQELMPDIFAPVHDFLVRTLAAPRAQRSGEPGDD